MLIQINNLLSFEDIVSKYGGPRSLWEAMRPHLPVWRLHNGEAIYLESQVDDFLRAYHQRLTLDSLPISQPQEQPQTTDYLSVLEVKKRFLGGKMSKEWWYGQIKRAALPHQRASDLILLRVKDVEEFVAKMRVEEGKRPAPLSPPLEQAAPSSPSPRRKKSQDGSGFRFFNG